MKRVYNDYYNQFFEAKKNLVDKMVIHHTIREFVLPNPLFFDRTNSA